MTYVVLAPEHELVLKITTPEQKKAVKDYVEKSLKKSEIERKENKEKTGVFTGAYAINPATKEKIPIWISDFVLAGYGTGAVFADAHDERDFEMAMKYNIPLKISIRPKDDELWEKVKKFEECYEGEGTLVNSGNFDGLTSREARKKITEWLNKEEKARFKINYKLRDWCISRQRYWGPPIPIIYCKECGTVAVPEKDLPVKLPELKEGWEPSGNGKGPLENVESFINTTCPKCKGPAKREADVMDNFLDSAWYFFRYISHNNEKEIFDKKLGEKWLPVDFYVGGNEHAVLHLMYTRFITMFFMIWVWLILIILSKNLEPTG